MTKLFITLRAIVGGALGDKLGPFRYLAVPDGAAPDASHVVQAAAWIRQVMATLKHEGDVITGDILFFVHGYNNDLADADANQELIRRGLDGKFDCTIIGFDWPSWKAPFAYLPELDVAKKTAIELVNAGVKPLLRAQSPKCQVAVHVLCHSMGAYVVREALDHADDGLETGTDWMINQLVMIAGDVEAADFVPGNKETESMLGHSYRLTNYFNKFDEVLQISNVKRAGVEPRAGRVGLPPDAPRKCVNVDCSAHFASLPPPPGGPMATIPWSHGWYFADATFHADLAATLRGAVDRTVIATRQPGPGDTLILA